MNSLDPKETAPKQSDMLYLVFQQFYTISDWISRLVKIRKGILSNMIYYNIYTINFRYLKHLMCQKNLSLDTFLLSFTYQHLLSQTTCISNKFSGTRKFTLRYHQFGMTFDFAVSRVDCTIHLLDILSNFSDICH